MSAERPLLIRVGEDQLLGILHVPTSVPKRGLVIVVGGPQYRVGSHRQFLLLARSLAASGVPVLRFDFRGAGDSDGEFPGFERVEADLNAAIGAFTEALPEIETVALWGLCDGASAVSIYAHKNPMVTGLVLLNPWTRTDSSLARTYLRHYYVKRFFEPAFWRKLASGKLNPARSLASLTENLRTAAASRGEQRHAKARKAAGVPSNLPLPERMRLGLEGFAGRMLLILSGNDLTAREFEDTVAASDDWQRLLSDSRVQRFDVEEADHTFSRREWRDAVADRTRDWLASW